MSNRIHVRPSGLRHFAITGSHMSKEMRDRYKDEMKAMKITDSSSGVPCPVCKVSHSQPCIDLGHKRYMPMDTVHMERAQACVGSEL